MLAQSTIARQRDGGVPTTLVGNTIYTETVIRNKRVIATTTEWNQMATFSGISHYRDFNNDPQTARIYNRIPYVFSCEEFPPASSIQGGSNALPYCAPFQGSKISCDGRRKTGFPTEQQWQANGIKALRLWAEGDDGFTGDWYSPTNILFEYSFRMVRNSRKGAVWVEVNEGGQQRIKYCYGPYGSGTDNTKCGF
ncbi:hypothetical protein ABW19_dt0204159 [Dactylella cylindrospora]|nr:hypothetical protein ABW19_dt0204159 [Dactylella cylindrospora]